MQKVIPAFVLEPGLSPLEQEGKVLKYFEDHFSTNIKKLKKLAVQLYTNPEVPEHAKVGVVTSVLHGANPVKFLKEAFKEISDLPIIMQGLRDDGNHGMIMDGAKIYGIEVDTGKSQWLRDGLRWNVDDESEIAYNCVERFMEEQLLKKFRGKILLFAEYGFSGMPRLVDQEFTKEYYETLILRLAR